MKTVDKMMLIAMVLLAYEVNVMARDGGEDWEKKAAFLSGVSDVEELSEEVMERFSSFRERPLDINAAPRGKLEACGMMTDFQVESLIEYRSASGDIMSFAELALVPGFSAEYAEALKPFVTLKTCHAPGYTDRRNIGHNVTLRTAIRRGIDSEDTAPEASWGLKYAGRYGEKAELLWSTRTTYDDASIKVGTISAALYGRRSLGKVVLGNFNARFGQGLTQWSGFTISGYPTIASFRKNGTGISPTGSFSPELNGAAADWALRHFTVTGAASFADGKFLTISNIKWTARRATFGGTCAWSQNDRSATIGTDWRIGLPGLSLFGEIAAKTGPAQSFPFAAVSGAVWTPGYGTKLALTGRYYDPSFKKEWSGAAIGFENPWVSATLDAARNISKNTDQFKSVIRFGYEFRKDSLCFSPSIRLNARVRPADDLPKRIDLRGDILFGMGPWRLNGRYNVLWSKAFAWLWYLEAGRVTDGRKWMLSLYSRFSLFCIDNWDDRIYVYERDAPGSFNVPSYYGRGFAASFTGSFKRRGHSLYLRGSLISYPWNVEPKPGRIEVKLQYTLNISGNR